MDLGKNHYQMEFNLRDNLKMILGLKESLESLINLLMKENFKMINRMVMEFYNFKMVQLIKDNLKMVSQMVMELKKIKMVQLMKDNLKMVS
jgi:hypothetical protein